jgi:hypothetical protein
MYAYNVYFIFFKKFILKRDIENLQVYDNLLLSPGENTEKYIEKDIRKREYQKNYKDSIEYKKRRKQLKSTMVQQVLFFTVQQMCYHEDYHI